ncbi:hypothetical protein SODALDRAFT_332082 [Sodiomyces alkalinus F11]|uniref:Uncharacterized protein n=1 Tax=Sodiomyces alkalinus (strain CBS 110278 / VKM F-3762 / F11) TaxID=1314773 RepID=A0A3N2PZI1_SODAK|nr:hypothetical protein SODALDRAFT_332082 [Sodiomyces alkalinus F11]ROT39931.1 hypothetical protein SODALDRAFT_332082 [Sodiomyces alkalinus F11]
MADPGSSRTSPDPRTRKDDEEPSIRGNTTSPTNPQEAPRGSPSPAGVPEEQQPQSPEPAPAAPQPVPKLEPPGFFTLVTNTKFGATLAPGAAGPWQSTRHPRIHYIFADDDPATLTAALAAAAAAHDSDAKHQDRGQQAQLSSSSPSASIYAREGGEAPGRRSKNHAILVDVVPDTAEGDDNAAAAAAAAGGGGGVNTGTQWRVASVSSLSPDFAVTEARITRMEESSSALAAMERRGGGGGGGAGLGRGGEEEEVSNGGALMLKIEGVELAEEDAVGAGPAGLLSLSGTVDKDAPDTKEDYGSLMDEFDKKMSVLRKVTAAGEQWVRMAEEDPSDVGPELQPGTTILDTEKEEDQAERKDS